MRYLVRSAALSGYEELASRLGIDIAPLLHEAKLSRSCLRDPDLMISTEAVSCLLEATARDTGHPNFGLMLAETRQMSNLGVVALVAREEPTLRAAINSASRYLSLHNQAITIRLEEVGEIVILHLNFLVAGRAIRQGVELAMGVMARLLRGVTRDRLPLQMVCFTHSAPSSLAIYRRVFETDVVFESEFNGMVFSRSTLDSPVPAADPDMLRQVKRQLDTMLANTGQGMEGSVRQLVAMLMPMGHCTVERVAEHLGVDRRTVQRHLLASGTSFTELVNDIRGELAQRFLESGNRSITEVADLLGFNAASSFSRWFRIRFGTTAVEWRNRAMR
jgi:AraC-like DNA-binding protein